MEEIQLVECWLKNKETISLPHKQINDGMVASEVLHAMTDHLPNELFIVLCLNGQNEIINTSVVSKGGAHGACMTPDEVFRPAILSGARGIIIGHNHPSGDVTPSQNDKDVVIEISRGCKILGLVLLDSFVVARNGKTFSWAERGML